MGNRSVTVFKDEQGHSPGVYMHWNGNDTTDFIKAASKQFRAGDSCYSAARFCGYCHMQLDGNTGLGLMPPPPDGDKTDWSFEGYGHGDAGTFVVDVNTGKVTIYGFDGKEDNSFDLGELPA
ncbi:hypothetical protein LCGC14_2174530 [marine sediment metagenome]|uniref:Uncharacterized protein n=1 Tax=marine sediment metagenome TaxID=412755 RepID=A0A0F9GJW8_9ZZZZ